MNDFNIDLDDILGLGRTGLYFQFSEDETVALPQLHFLLYRDNDPDGEDIVTGICLEFGLVYSRPKEEEAFLGLKQLCVDYINRYIPKNTAKEEIIAEFLNLVKDRKIEDLWELYRMSNFRTALRGKPTVDLLKLGAIAQLEAENAQLKAENAQLKANMAETASAAFEPANITETPALTRDISLFKSA